MSEKKQKTRRVVGSAKTETSRTSRRNFLASALAAGGAAATVGFPAIVKAAGATTLRVQSGFATKDIYHEYGLNLVQKINDMTGGDLRVELLSAGAVVPAFNLLEATSKGVIDGGHGALPFHYGKQPALGLWGSSPSFGMDANMLIAWHRHGGGKELLEKIYSSIGANVVSFLWAPFIAEPLGWFKKPVTKPEDFKGLKFRTTGLAIDMYTGMGAAVTALPGGEIIPALDRGLLDGAEYSNPTSDRQLGFPDVSKVYMLHSYHQVAQQLELTLNKDKFNALPEKMRAIVMNAIEASSAAMSWSSIDRFSKDYLELQTKDKVKMYKTPDSVLKKQLESYDAVLKKYSGQNPLFDEVARSQMAFAKRALGWDLQTNVNRAVAYNHYFGKKKSS